MAKDVPKGKWSLDYDRCVNCGTSLIPHKADGLCERCYMWAYRQARKMGFISERTKRGEIRRGKHRAKKKTATEDRGPREATK